MFPKVPTVSTTKMSSKGQVVIPESVREHLHLDSGVQFVVMATDDTVILKKINPIPDVDVKKLLRASKKMAKDAGLSEEDIESTIQDERRGSSTRKSSGKTKKS